MIARFEEMLGRALIVLAFGFFAVGQMVGVLARFRQSGDTSLWSLGFAVQVLSLAFVLLVVVMTLRRLPATSSAAGLEPRLAAIAGTFLLMLLTWLPPGAAPATAQLGATVLLVVGTAGSIYCLHYLGRSFSILASARELVTGGPYGVIRHPLYVAEAFSVLGIVIGHWSWAALLVGAAQFALQWRRMQHEERVLRAAFSAYEGYALRVPMLVPRGAG